jgi:multidrug efflux pump subunit AcrB
MKSQATDKKQSLQKQAFSVLIVFAALSLAGIAFLPKMKFQRNPSQPLPQIRVQCQWPATAPRITEQQITTPLEGVLNTVQGIRKITSQTTSTTSTITLDVDKDKSLEKIRYEVSTVVRRVFPRLPETAGYPTITLNSVDNEAAKEPLLVYSLQSTEKQDENLRQYAEIHLKKYFFGIPSLAAIRIQGGTKKAVYIETNPRMLETHHITLQNIFEALDRYFSRKAIGFTIDSSQTTTRRLAVIVEPSKGQQADWDNIIVNSTAARNIRLTDICQVHKKQQPPRSHYRINGLESINLLFYPSNDANYLALAKDIQRRMDQATSHLPDTYHLFLTVDNTRFISNELTKIGWRSTATVFILLLFVLLVSLSFRYLLVIFLSLVVNITISFSLYYLLGIHIHLYSLAGITISLGLIIDNTIVMIDHIRHQGNKKVYLALLASTLTTIASLAIAWFLPEKLKLTLLDFAYIIMINLAVSLAVSLWFIPALMQEYPLRGKSAGAFIKRKRFLVVFNRIYFRIITFVTHHKGWMTAAGILIFGIPVFMLPEKMEGDGWIAGSYNKTIGSEWYQKKAEPIVERVVGGGLRLFVKYVYEGSQFRKNEETRLYIYAGLPKGGTLEQLNQVMKEMEGYLASFDKIAMFTTNVYSPQSAYINIRFRKDEQHTAFPYILKGNVTRKALNFGGMEWSIYGVGQGFYNNPGSSQSFNYQSMLTGYNYDELEKQAQRLKSLLEKNPRTAEVNTNMKYSWRSDDYDYVFRLTPDLSVASLYGVTLPDIFRQIRWYDQTPSPFMQVTSGREIMPVYLTDKQIDRNGRYRFENALVRDHPVRIKSLTTLHKEQVSPDIYKENQQYVRKVGFRYNGIFKFGRRLQNNALAQLQAEMPMGYKAQAQDFNYWSQQKQKPYHLLLIIFVMIFIIGAVLFESLRQPFTLIVVILLSFTGIFFTFYWFDMTFDQGGYASFIMLSGLVVNAAIYIINDYNNIRKKGSRAFIRAYNHKIIPILLTLVSTILGLVPFVLLGSSEPFWFAFAAGTIGGLVFSIPVLFFFLPVYLIQTNIQR